MKIAAGAGKGLKYLHGKANPPVINRNFRSSNILLDEGFHQKLSDFGLAKLAPVGDKSHVSTRVVGTNGYCGPEYSLTGQLTIKSSVYSFAVVVSELITGHKAIDSSCPHGERNLVTLAAVRPLIGDRVMALSYLANQANDPNIASNFGNKGTAVNERGGAILRNEDAGGSGRISREFEESGKNDSPRDGKLLKRDVSRERAAAEAKM
ncbi:hypothetical protein NL676_019943 [Syzygium grande]|nr:hypothetical protein NL676_019943 [Syzygium grande]